MRNRHLSSRGTLPLVISNDLLQLLFPYDFHTRSQELLKTCFRICPHWQCLLCLHQTLFGFFSFWCLFQDFQDWDLPRGVTCLLSPPELVYDQHCFQFTARGHSSSIVQKVGSRVGPVPWSEGTNGRETGHKTKSLFSYFFPKQKSSFCLTWGKKGGSFSVCLGRHPSRHYGL